MYVFFVDFLRLVILKLLVLGVGGGRGNGWEICLGFFLGWLYMWLIEKEVLFGIFVFGCVINCEFGGGCLLILLDVLFLRFWYLIFELFWCFLVVE